MYLLIFFCILCVFFLFMICLFPRTLRLFQELITASATASLTASVSRTLTPTTVIYHLVGQDSRIWFVSMKPGWCYLEFPPRTLYLTLYRFQLLDFSILVYKIMFCFIFVNLHGFVCLHYYTSFVGFFWNFTSRHIPLAGSDWKWGEK